MNTINHREPGEFGEGATMASKPSEPINGIITAWMPEQDQHRLAVLGKLIEELNEASKAAARCIIHGIEQTDPGTGRTNKQELQRELDDVTAAMFVARERLQLWWDIERTDAKVAGFDRWHDLIDAEKAKP